MSDVSPAGSAERGPQQPGGGRGGGEGPSPPALALWWLEHVVPRELREPLMGDLLERYHLDIVPARGAAAAGRWFLGEALRAPLRLPRAGGAPTRTTASGDGLMARVLQDLRYALRLLARRPGFAAVTVLTLALGIGATTAIFSAVHPILFASLPYPRADRLAMVYQAERDGGRDFLGYATYRDIVDASRTIRSAAAIGFWQTVLTGREEPELLNGLKVSAPFFRTLGVRPVLGRDFTETEDRPNGPRVTILTDGLWRRRFGADSSIIGKVVTLSGRAYQVVGVLPAGFRDVLAPTAQLYTPLRYDVTLPYACRTCHHLRMLARLRNGVSFAAASRELDVISRRMVAEHPTEYSRPGLELPSLQADLTGGVRGALLATFGAVLLVLLIACVNVTNMLLSRAAERHGEFALRTALGAGRGILVRQLLTESVLLAWLGGALGVGVAVLGVHGLVALAPSGLPLVSEIRVNVPVLLFTLGVTVIVGLAFGMAPALHATSRGASSAGDLHHDLQQAARRVTGGRRVTRGALVVAEVALALMLLVGSGLLLRSMARLLAVPAGFDERGLMTLQIQASGPAYASDTVTWQFFNRVLADVRGIPGVQAAALTSQLPLSGDFDGYGVAFESRPQPNPEDNPSAFRYAVSPGYLETMGIPLIRGRRFTAADRGGAAPVVIVSEGLARRVLGDADPIGERVQLGCRGEGCAWRTIVGVVGNVKQVSLSATSSDAIYLPETQWLGADGAMSLVIRTSGDPGTIVPAVRRAVWSVDSNQPITRVATMASLVAATAAQRRFTLVLFEVFGVVALLLAAAGIYGVLSSAVVERRQEMGVRAALGATHGNLLGLVLRQGLGFTLIGAALGIAGAIVMSRFLESLLFEVQRLDPMTYAAVTGLLGVVALAACLVPAWQAMRLDPSAVLRAE